MTLQERYKKYKKEVCKTCVNKNSDKCEIRVFELEGKVCTKCIEYEKERRK